MFLRKFDGFQSKSQKHIFFSLFIHHSFEVYLLKEARIRYSVLHDGNCNILDMGALWCYGAASIIVVVLHDEKHFGLLS